ncbi:MAG: putative zinc protease [bacterium]|nr:putative zinc protease [bacterium]
MKHGLIASLCGRTRRLMALGILIPAFALAQGEDPVRPDRPEQIRFPEQQFHPPKPERVVLKNGLVVYLLPDPMIPQIRLSGLIHAGSLRETAKESGLAGLTAEVLRLGGSTITPATEMNRLLEYAGADLEAGAQRDYVALSLRVLSKDRDLGIRLLGEILLHPAFPEDKLNQRRAEALEELRRQNDDPSEITRREFRKLLFGDHPYGRDPLGAPETLLAFTREDLVRWHERWWRPNFTIFSVAGDFTRDEMLALLEKELGAWAKSDHPETYPPVAPTANLGKRFFIEKDLNQSTVRIGHLGVPRNSADKVPIEVLNFILGGGGFSSRLFNKVRNESGYAYTAVSEFEESLLRGQFLAFLQTQTANTVKAAALAKEIIETVAKGDDLTEGEVALAKESKLNDFVFKFETPADVARQYAQLEYFGLPPDYLETYRERLAGVTLQDVRRVAREYLKPSELTILILGNPSVRGSLEELGEFSEIELTEGKDLSDPESVP